MYVQSLKLENIKAFESLELDFARPGESGDALYAGMNVFVGGNSSGKSTLLKSIALALSGPTVANQLLETPAGWVTHNAHGGSIDLNILKCHGEDGHTREWKQILKPASLATAGLMFGTESPGVTSKLEAKVRNYSSSEDRIEDANDKESLWDVESPGWFLSGYGPFRRLSGSSSEASRKSKIGGKLSSCITLFREDAALSECETWLKKEYARGLERQIQNEQSTNHVKDLIDLLNDGLMPVGFNISRVSVDDIFMTTPNGDVLPMRDLSDGFRSVFSLILDIIPYMIEAFPDQFELSRDESGKLSVKNTGVILIDELEAHLHPSWQSLICDWLKTRFPNIQFFVTTHSPLIAQAADEGGLYVLPLPNELSEGQTVRRLSPQEQERVSLGRAEKVLLGEAFGLSHTWSSRAQAIVKRWEHQAAKRQARGSLPASEQDEYKELARQVEIIFDDDPDEVFNA